MITYFPQNLLNFLIYSYSILFCFSYIHFWSSFILSLSMSSYLSVSLSVCLSICLPVCVPTFLFWRLSFILFVNNVIIYSFSHYEQSEIWVGRSSDVGAHLSVPSVRGDKVSCSHTQSNLSHIRCSDLHRWILSFLTYRFTSVHEIRFSIWAMIQNKF